ncbi:MAG: zinc ribbon domain-containing protein [Thermoplasmatales archaeon]|nr:zinc ribbon domain-containing protein [Thermoplasmatales archaeon]
MEGEDSAFCVHCGRKMPADSAHCPNCGMAVDKGSAYASGQIPYSAAANVKSGRLDLAKILLILYVALSVLSVLSLPMSLSMPEDPAVADVFAEWGLTYGDIKDMSIVSAVFTVISLALAGVSLYHVLNKGKWKPAWTFCAAASLVYLASVPVYLLMGLRSAAFLAMMAVGAAFSIGVGLIVTYFIYESKAQFSDVESRY